jgi:hypothetical protein
MHTKVTLRRQKNQVAGGRKGREPRRQATGCRQQAAGNRKIKVNCVNGTQSLSLRALGERERKRVCHSEPPEACEESGPGPLEPDLRRQADVPLRFTRDDRLLMSF